MKALLATIVVTALMQAPPVQAQQAEAETVAVQTGATATDDLPLTPRFSSLLSSYRDCVLHEVDEKIALGNQRDMAQQAMSACALSRGEMRAQLVSDILKQDPALSAARAASAADTGVDQIEPMIEQAAIDWAHVRYARTMH